MEVENSLAAEYDPWNGLMLNSYFLPEEVLIHLLSFVDPRSLVFQCRYVCRQWHDLITDTALWKLKVRRSNIHSLSKYDNSERKRLMARYPWYMYYWVLNEVPFEQNLLQNNCGQNRLKDWEVVLPERMQPLGDQFWDVEMEPKYADPLPKSDDFGGNRSCFSTSYVLCLKTQLIDLQGIHRFPRKLLDDFQPTITISEWYAGRYDCGCEYSLQVQLIDVNNRVLVSIPSIKKRREQWQGEEWNKLTVVIKNYGRGLRYIRFTHGGKDTQFWRGNYGSKMAGGVVRISLVEIPEVEGSEVVKPVMISIL